MEVMSQKVKDCCVENNCKVKVDWEALVNDENLAVCARLNLFIDAVEADGKLHIEETVIEKEDKLGVGEKAQEYFSIKDSSRGGVSIFVPVNEVIEKCDSKKRAELICSAIKGSEEEGRQFLRAYTRIVGYYSRISNYNNSKKGEVVSRHAGNYRVDGSFRTEQEKQTCQKYMDNLKR